MTACIHIERMMHRKSIAVLGESAATYALVKLIPYGRIGLPDDIGRAVAWLASDDADYIHGQTIYVDGGMTLYPEFARGG